MTYILHFKTKYPLWINLWLRSLFDRSAIFIAIHSIDLCENKRYRVQSGCTLYDNDFACGLRAYVFLRKRPTIIRIITRFYYPPLLFLPFRRRDIFWRDVPPSDPRTIQCVAFAPFHLYLMHRGITKRISDLNTGDIMREIKLPVVSRAGSSHERDT